MKQLVSVVDEAAIRYYVHDGEDTKQIATIANPGLEIDAVLELGVGLGKLFELNGYAKPEPVAEVVPPKVKAVAKKSAPAPVKRAYTRWTLTIEQIADYVKLHPGLLVVDVANQIGEALDVPMPTDSSARRTAVDNRVRPHLERAKRDGTPPLVRMELDGEGRMRLWPAG